ncbi:hypothetical protein [Rhizobium sp. J15]|uniref:hypothetical protein n=1 Tax=Rhizobium sp. J15 TaxID=2035450 RepID=UPI001142A227|nr:hypothetical protein [Rhizobium sp. J15]
MVEKFKHCSFGDVWYTSFERLGDISRIFSALRLRAAFLFGCAISLPSLISKFSRYSARKAAFMTRSSKSYAAGCDLLLQPVPSLHIANSILNDDQFSPYLLRPAVALGFGFGA